MMMNARSVQNVSSMDIQNMPRQQHVEKIHQNYEEEMERIHRISLLVFKKKYSHQLASKMYGQRQLFFIYMPLQFLALLTSLIGFVMGTSLGDEDVHNTIENWSSFAIGILGVITLMYNNIGKKFDYDSISTSHALVADNMRWLLHDLELIQHKFRRISGCSCSIDDNGSSMDCGSDSVKDQENNTCENCKKMEKFKEMIDENESRYFMESRTPPPMLPRQIEIAFEKLTVQFELMFPTVGNKKGISSNEDLDLDLDLDDATYFNIMKLAFGEMAIVLGDSDNQWLITLPDPNYAVEKTMIRISKMLSSVKENHPANDRLKNMISALAISSRNLVSNKRKFLCFNGLNREQQLSTLSDVKENTTGSASY